MTYEGHAEEEYEKQKAGQDETLRNIGITPRERLERIENMLVNIDEKLDVKADKTEMLQLEARVRAIEVEGSRLAREAIHKADVLAHERLRDIEQLEVRLVKFDSDLASDVERLRKDHSALSSRVSWAFGAVAAIVALSDIIIRMVSR
jgi:hypothetical protein